MNRESGNKATAPAAAAASLDSLFMKREERQQRHDHQCLHDDDDDQDEREALVALQQRLGDSRHASASASAQVIREQTPAKAAPLTHSCKSNATNLLLMMLLSCRSSW